MTFKLLSVMTNVNSNNGNETKSDIFLWHIFKSDVISFSIKNILMAFLIDIIQFHCTTEHKQVIKSSVACANLTAFSLIYEVLQCLHDVLNLFLDKAYLKMKIPAVPEETYSLF